MHPEGGCWNFLSVRIFSTSIQGIDAYPVEVEVDSAPGIHSFHIVGLADKAVQESQERISSAIRNSGLVPASAKHKKILVNLAPADTKKEGPAYDLPIAIGYLLETGQIRFDSDSKLFSGELSLDGSLRHTNGILATAILAKNKGFHEIIVPAVNAEEAALVGGISVIGARNIKSVIGHLDGTVKIDPHKIEIQNSGKTEDNEDPFRFIHGQYAAKRALTVSAAGGHNILFNGAPGAGKTILAKALQELLPPLSFTEAIEVAKIYSAVGMTKNKPLTFDRPFRSPHHTTSPAAVVGGGTWPKPGEISLAHRGVLFLDELPEFHRNVLESLRQPLEDGVVTISRASGSLILPAKFTLVAAMNPCPCGNYGDESASCTCPPLQVLRYRKKISGPLLDRIDIQVNVPRETLNSGKVTAIKEDSSQIKQEIVVARQLQAQRYAKTPFITNADINYKTIDRFCILIEPAENFLKQVVGSRKLSLRSYHKIKKISRTIADLEQSEHIAEQHVAEAVSLRVNDVLFSDLT